MTDTIADSLLRKAFAHAFDGPTHEGGPERRNERWDVYLSVPVEMTDAEYAYLIQLTASSIE